MGDSQYRLMIFLFHDFRQSVGHPLAYFQLASATEALEKVYVRQRGI